MPLNLISNFAANVAQRNLAMSDAAATVSLAKLSAGTRVVSAKDDAASLAIGSRLEAERSGLNQALVNAGQAISMLQIADGAMSYVNDVLIRMKSLAVQAGSGSLSGTERSMINTEYQALLSEAPCAQDITLVCPDSAALRRTVYPLAGLSWVMAQKLRCKISRAKSRVPGTNFPPTAAQGHEKPAKLLK